MPGIHGKNAQMYVTSSTQVVASGTMTQVGSTDVYQADSSNRNWIYTPASSSALVVEYQVGPNWYNVEIDSNQINYAAGAAKIINVTDATYVAFKNALRGDVTAVGNKVNQNRSWDISFEVDDVDATVMGEYWGSTLPGIPRFNGSIDGLQLDADKYQKAVVNASGVQPRFIARFVPDVGNVNTYYQGSVRFAGWSMTASYDAPIEETLDFNGDGPLDLVINGEGFFGPLTF